MMGKPLMGVVLFGSSKDYVVPKWWEMYRACCEGLVDLFFVSDNDIAGVETLVMPSPSGYSEDQLIVAREAIRCLAIDRGHPSYIFQGIDCLYQSRAEFENFLRRVTRVTPVIGALTSSRMDANVAVARGFMLGDHGEVFEEQYDYEHVVIESCIDRRQLLGINGFPGADALHVHASCFDYNWHGHTPWYTRVEQGRPNLCAEEFLIWRMVNDGVPIYLDCATRTWHVHEDNVARMFPGITVGLDTLTW